MSVLETLLEAGAELVAGSVILDRVKMGSLRDGDLRLTPDGRAKMAELNGDGDEKPAKPAAKKAPAKKAAAKKTAAKKTAEKVDEPEEAQEPETEDDGMDDLLKDLDV